MGRLVPVGLIMIALFALVRLLTPSRQPVPASWTRGGVCVHPIINGVHWRCVGLWLSRPLNGNNHDAAGADGPRRRSGERDVDDPRVYGGLRQAVQGARILSQVRLGAPSPLPLILLSSDSDWRSLAASFLRRFFGVAFRSPCPLLLLPCSFPSAI